MSMCLHVNTAEEKFESFGELLSFLEGASSHKITRIWAVSAYYDIESIKQLIDHIKSRISKKTKPELFIVIGAINHGELEALQKMKFGKMFREGSGIRVTNCGRLFHSKGYLVETGRNGMCAIGSMNLTQAGLKKNEELLTCFQYKQSRVPALVKAFKAHVEDWHSDKMSKKIGAVLGGELGIRWLDQNHPHDQSMQENDSDGLLSSPEFPHIADESAVHLLCNAYNAYRRGVDLNEPAVLRKMRTMGVENGMTLTLNG